MLASHHPLLPSVQDRLYHTWRPQYLPQQLAEVAALDALRHRHLGDRGVPPLIQQTLIAERARQRLRQRRVSPYREGRPNAEWSATPGP
jgi:hypothetical protein